MRPAIASTGQGTASDEKRRAEASAPEAVISCPQAARLIDRRRPEAADPSRYAPSTTIMTAPG